MINKIKKIITIILTIMLLVEQPCFTVLAADASGNTKVVTEEASGNEIIEEDDLIESEELVDGVEDTQRGLDTVDDTLESEEVIDGAEEGEHVLIVSGGEEGVDYSWSDDGVLTVKTSIPLVIDGQGIKVTDEQIVLGDAANKYEINITLKNVKITSSTGAAIKIPDDYREDVNIVLDGENIIKSGANFAGLEKNGGSNTGILTIVGEGSIDSTGSNNGAGIGGGDHGIGSNITINGGTVTATGGYHGAGIGGGYYGAGNNITINGGKVTATGGVDGAGIGGGYQGAGNKITISGGKVTATGGVDGAGIGGGYYGAGSNITISGGTVTAKGGEYGAGIGGGKGRAGSDIKIENASVKAVAGYDANDIGGGGSCDAVIPLDHYDGDNVYLVCLLHEDNLTIKYKLHSEEEWNTIVFPEKHENDERFYLYLKEGVYDFKSGTAEYLYVPVGTYGGAASKEVSTRKIIIDELILGDELTIVSENCYKMGNVVYDCSAATDSYFIEQRTSETLNKNIVVKEASKIIVKNLNLCPENKAAFFV
ncbi:MAG: hypothetical protein IKQ88_04625, partial [Lachnospiraceae bacterium]|nr:hypothetical protein [Lachnospiraceae bacterium]